MRVSELHAALLSQALGYPEAYQEDPWGHPAIKVGKKVFLFSSSLGSDAPSASVKLPLSAADALLQDGVTPMGYGLGKHGWCSLTLTPELSLDQLLDWLDESYRAVAPKRLVKGLGNERPSPAVLDATPTPEPAALPRVLLVGAGPRRLERGCKALAKAGVAAASVSLDDALDAAGDLQPESIVVDVGRQAVAARGLVADLRVVCSEAAVWVAGLQTKTLPASMPDLDGVYRAPPGDPEVVNAVLAALGASPPA